MKLEGGTAFETANAQLNRAQQLAAYRSLLGPVFITEGHGIRVSTPIDRDGSIAGPSSSTVSLIAKALALIANTGGATIDKKGRIPESGFAVGGAATQRILALGTLGLDSPYLYDQIKRFFIVNLEALSNGLYFGAWNHEGKLYLDIVNVLSDKEEALTLARERSQLAIYNLKNGKEINC